MGISTTERRQIENEMTFRKANEKVVKGLEELDAMHIENGNNCLVSNEDVVLDFLCECSDEDCTQRIPNTLSEFRKIHKNRKKFIVKPGHQVEAIERVEQKKSEYNVVMKNNMTKKTDDNLHKTPVKNS